MFRANRSGKMIQINPEMVWIPGLNATGEGIDYLERGDHKQCDSILHNGFMGKLRDNGCVENFEYDALCADGRHIWLLINAKMNSDLDRKSFVVDGFILDIAGRKKAEEQMLLAKLAAEEASRYKSELLANMNHELWMSLNSILGFSDILMGECLITL
jgi:PAS domain S-box-containing protein